MKCSHCQQGRITIRPTCTGVELGCPGCGHVYSPEEFRELLSRRRARAGLSRPTPDPGDRKNDGVA